MLVHLVKVVQHSLRSIGGSHNMSEEQNNYTTPASTRLAKSIPVTPKNVDFATSSITKYITIVPPKHNKSLNGNKGFKSYKSSNTSTIDTHNEVYGDSIDPVHSPIDPHRYNLPIDSHKSENMQDGNTQLVKAEDDPHSNDDINPYNVKSLEEILDGVDPIEYKKMIRDYSSRMFKRISNCGSIVNEFKASKGNKATYVSSQCHSDLCFECVRNDRRTYNRVINEIGHDLMSNFLWIKLIITINKEYRHHFLDYKVTNKFLDGMWDLVSNVLDLNGEESMDRGGAVLKWHWFGKLKMNFNPHLEMMIPCIRYGLPFSNIISQKDLKRIKRGMARRLSNITGELVPPSRMNVKNKPKSTLGEVLHGFRYQLRSTINFKALMKAPKAVKQFIVDGRHGRKQVRYKSKLWSTELEKWYSYLGFDYDKRTKHIKKEWVDDKGVPYKFVKMHNAYTLKNELRQYGTGLRSISRVSFCIDHPKIVTQKINEVVKSGLESNNYKLVLETMARLKNFNPDGFKMSWTDEVIALALNRKNYMIENEGITTDISKQRIKYMKSMNKDDREHWLDTGSGDESGNVKSGFPTKTTNSIKRR